MIDENKPYLFLTRVILELPNQDAVLRVADQLQRVIEAFLGDLPDYLGYQGTDFVHIYSPDVNSGRCAVCGLWVTDHTKPDPVVGLRYGETVGGLLLCEDHLPASH